MFLYLGRCVTAVSWRRGDAMTMYTNVWVQTPAEKYIQSFADCFKYIQSVALNTFSRLPTALNHIKLTCEGAGNSRKTHGALSGQWNDFSVHSYGNNPWSMVFTMDFCHMQCHILDRVTICNQSTRRDLGQICENCAHNLICINCLYQVSFYSYYEKPNNTTATRYAEVMWIDFINNICPLL